MPPGCTAPLGIFRRSSGSCATVWEPYWPHNHVSGWRGEGHSVELTVHTLDLTRAVDLPNPAVLGPAMSPACELAGRPAARRSNVADILFGILGRAIPPQARNAL